MAQPMSHTGSDLDALQACLAAEHLAIYAYGVLGGRLTGLHPPTELVEQVDESYEWHRSQRDALDASIRTAGDEPVAAEAAYGLPLTPDTVGECGRLARYVENRCGQAYAYAVSVTAIQTRGGLADALAETAVRAAAFGGRLTAFPGRPDL
jgi:hypothetical protein